MSRKVRGEQSRETAVCLNSLALILEDEGKYVLPNKLGAVHQWDKLRKTLQPRLQDNKIKEQVKTKPSFLFFSSGVFDPEQLDADVASIRRYYENHGFFDARVGRKVVVSPDQKEVQVEYVIDEGRRYVVDRISFRGNHDDRVTEDVLRKDLKMTEGRFYDEDLVKRDIVRLGTLIRDIGIQPN